MKDATYTPALQFSMRNLVKIEDELPTFYVRKRNNKT